MFKMFVIRSVISFFNKSVLKALNIAEHTYFRKLMVTKRTWIMKTPPCIWVVIDKWFLLILCQDFSPQKRPNPTRLPDPKNCWNIRQSVHPKPKKQEKPSIGTKIFALESFFLIYFAKTLGWNLDGVAHDIY